jgi:hypothetical protein
MEDFTQRIASVRQAHSFNCLECVKCFECQWNARSISSILHSIGIQNILRILNS